MFYVKNLRHFWWATYKIYINFMILYTSTKIKIVFINIFPLPYSNAKSFMYGDTFYQPNFCILNDSTGFSSTILHLLRTMIRLSIFKFQSSSSVMKIREFVTSWLDLGCSDSSQLTIWMEAASMTRLSAEWLLILIETSISWYCKFIVEAWTATHWPINPFT